MVLIPLFRSFIFTSIRKLNNFKEIKSFNPFIQVFYFYKIFLLVRLPNKELLGFNPFIQVFYFYFAATYD